LALLLKKLLRLVAESIIARALYVVEKNRRRSAEDRKEIIGLTRNIQDEMKGFHAEMKSFHGRMCTLEERYLQILQSKVK
jgi:hypothetical protein